VRSPTAASIAPRDARRQRDQGEPVAPPHDADHLVTVRERQVGEDGAARLGHGQGVESGRQVRAWSLPSDKPGLDLERAELGPVESWETLRPATLDGWTDPPIITAVPAAPDDANSLRSPPIQGSVPPASPRIRMAFGPTPWMASSSSCEWRATCSRLAIPVEGELASSSLSDRIRKVSHRSHVRCGGHRVSLRTHGQPRDEEAVASGGRPRSAADASGVAGRGPPDIIGSRALPGWEGR
jgi:hypothetical protein